MTSGSHASLAELIAEVRANPGGSGYPVLARELSKLGRHKEAALVTERGVALSPSADGLRVLAEIRLTLGQPEASVDAARRLLRMVPSDETALSILRAHGELECQSADPPAIMDELADSELSAAMLAAIDGRGSEGSSLQGRAPEASLETADRDREDSSLDRSWSAGVEMDTDSMELAADDEPALYERLPGGGTPESRDLSAQPVEPRTEAPPDSDHDRPESPHVEDCEWPADEMAMEPSTVAAPRGKLDGGASSAPSAGDTDGERAPSPPRARTAVGLRSGRGRRAPFEGRAGLATPKEPILPSLNRRHLVYLSAAVILAVGVTVAGLSWKRAREDRAFEEALAASRTLIAMDFRTAYLAAGEHLGDALRVRPRDPEALALAAYGASRLHTEFDGGTEALLLAEDHLALAEPQPRLSPRGAAARALLHLSAARPADAISTVTRALHETPDEPVLLWARALAEQALERGDLALESAQAALTADPSFAPAARLVALLLESGGSRSEASAVRLALLEAHEAHLPTLNRVIADALAGRIRRARALDAAHRGCLAAPTFGCSTACEEELSRELTALCLAAARIAILENEPALASAAENRAMLVSLTPESRSEVARHLERRHRHEEAFALLTEIAPGADSELWPEAARAAIFAGEPRWVLAAESDVGRDSAVTALMALATLHMGDVAGALRLAGQALASSSRPEAPALVAQALALDVVGEREEAIAAATRAVPLARGPSEVLLVGSALLSLDADEQAAAVLTRAVGAGAEPHYGLLVQAARALQATRRQGAALHHLERAILLNPEVADAIDSYFEIAPPRRADAFVKRLPEPWSTTLEPRAPRAAASAR